MKNTDQIEVAASAVALAIPKGLGVVLTCHNLRPADAAAGASAGLSPVGDPAPAFATTMLPLLRFDRLGRRYRLWHEGVTLALSVDDGEPQPLGELGAPAVSASLWCDTARILTEEGYEYVDLTGPSPQLLGPMPALPHVRIRAIAESTMSAPVSGGSVTTPLDSHGGALNGADTAAVSSAMLTAYSRLTSKVAAAGRYLQPVIARYRIIAPDGSLLFLSSPVMVCAHSGFQCLGACSARISGGSTWRSESSLSADTFVLGVDVPPGLQPHWRRLAARIDILLSPMIHPADFAGFSTTSYSVNSEGTATARFTLPGAPSDFSGSGSSQAGKVAAALRGLSGLMAVGASFADPFGDGIGLQGTTVTLRPRHSTAKKDWEAIRDAVPTPSAAETSMLVNRLHLPHRTVPSAECRIGAFTFVGDPRSTLFPGMNPRCFAAFDGASGAWRASIAVDVASEGRVVSSAAGVSGAPAFFSPLITYPLAEATSLTLLMECPDGTVRRRECALTPVEAEGFAYCLHPSVAPFIPDAAAAPYEAPVTTAVARRFDGVVLTAKGADTGSPLHALRLGTGKIAAFHEAMRTSSSLDFVRTKALVFGADGTHMLVADRKGEIVSVGHLDQRPVASRRSVVATTCAEVPLVAVAGEDLVKVASTRVSTLVRGVGSPSLGWSRRFAELWMVRPGAPAEVLALPSLALHTRDLCPSSLTPDGSSLLLTTPLGTLDACREQPAQSVGAIWEARVDCRGLRKHPPRWLLLGLCSPEIDGSLTITADNGAALTAATVASASIGGALRGELRLPLMLPRFDYLTLRLEAALSPFAALSGVTLQKA